MSKKKMMMNYQMIAAYLTQKNWKFLSLIQNQSETKGVGIELLDSFTFINNLVKMMIITDRSKTFKKLPRAKLKVLFQILSHLQGMKALSLRYSSVVKVHLWALLIKNSKLWRVTWDNNTKNKSSLIGDLPLAVGMS